MPTDNIHLGPDAQVNHNISVLRALRMKDALRDGASLMPGVVFAIDPEAKISGQFTSEGNSLIKLNYEIKTTPRWIALHFALGGVDFSDTTVFGVACKSQSSEAATMRVCLRSGVAGGFRDAFLPKHVVAFSQVSSHVDLLRLQGLDAVPATAPWRELILFFQTSSAQFDIIDLRVFIV